MGEKFTPTSNLDEAAAALLAAAREIALPRPNANDGTNREPMKALARAFWLANTEHWASYEKDNPRLVWIARKMADPQSNGWGDRLVGTATEPTMQKTPSGDRIDLASVIGAVAPLWTFYLDRAREALDLVAQSEQALAPVIATDGAIEGADRAG